MPATPSPLDSNPAPPRIDSRRAHAEALLEEFAVSWCGHHQHKGEWAQTDRALDELCTRVLLFLDPEGQP